MGHIWPTYQVDQPHSQTTDSILGEELFLPSTEISQVTSAPRQVLRNAILRPRRLAPKRWGLHRQPRAAARPSGTRSGGGPPARDRKSVV